MSQHFKSLFQQLQPLFNANIYQNNTPTKTKSNKLVVSEKSSQVKKETSSVTKQNKHKRAKNAQSSDESHLSSECSSTSSSSSSSCYLSQLSQLNTKRIKLQSNEIMTDSGLESSFATNKHVIRKKLNYCDEEEESQRIKSNKIKDASNESRKKCVCSNCLTRLNRLNEVIRKLRQARHYYFKSNLNEKNFANIPMLIVKSFRPQSNSLNKIEMRKGSAVNALFINENNKWLYVKTSNELTGFIPAKCCEPFYVNKYCQSKTGKSQSLQTPSSLLSTPLTSTSSTYSTTMKRAGKIELIPIDKPINKPDHTYMTINELDLKQEKQHKCESTCTPVSCDMSDQTVLSLFSISSNFQSEQHSNCNNCVSCCYNSNIAPETQQKKKHQFNIIKSDDSLVKYLKGNNKSRNRKIQLGLNKMPSAITLTMLEQHEQHESTYLNLAEAQSNQTKTNSIPQKKSLNLKPVQTIFEEESKIYDELVDFESQSSRECENKNNVYDFLVSSISPSSEKNSDSDNYYDSTRTAQCKKFDESDHYDVLMAYNSNSATKKLGKMKKRNEVLKKNMNLNLFKVTEDYTADFKGDLTVKRGDLVYLVEQSVEKECSNQNDWLYVRLYKRGRKSSNGTHAIYENISENCATNYNISLQGYVPRNHVIKL